MRWNKQYPLTGTITKVFPLDGRKVMGEKSIARSPAALIESVRFAKRWPGIEQVFRLERSATMLKTGEVRHQVVYGLSNLSLR